jgi:hypothetical protein
MKATHRLIDSVWTVEYKHVSIHDVEIIKYSRSDPEGYKREQELPQATIIEDEKRIVHTLLVRDEFHPFEWVNLNNFDHSYTVVNPKHIFDYGA